MGNKERNGKRSIESFCYKKIVLLILLLPVQIWAKSTQNFGAIAEAIMEPIGMVTKLIHVVCLVAGGAMVLGSIVRYKQYRNNPTEVRLSSCLMLLLAGVILIVLAFIPIPT